MSVINDKYNLWNNCFWFLNLYFFIIIFNAINAYVIFIVYYIFFVFQKIVLLGVCNINCSMLWKFINNWHGAIKLKLLPVEVEWSPSVIFQQPCFSQRQGEHLGNHANNKTNRFQCFVKKFFLLMHPQSSGWIVGIELV